MKQTKASWQRLREDLRTMTGHRLLYLVHIVMSTENGKYLRYYAPIQTTTTFGRTILKRVLAKGT